MQIPLWLADWVAKGIQKAPARLAPPDLAFADLPARVACETIPTRHGDLAATVYAPEGDPTGVYVNFHGGGFVMRHPEQDDPLCRWLAAHTGLAVVNVDYDTAPQARFPVPVEQAYDAAAWAADPARPWPARLVVGGQSAGGSLAAAVARIARDEGGPDIALQVLLYPPLDLTISSLRKKRRGTEWLLVPLGPVFDRAYCPDPARRADPLISPALDGSGTLDGLPPAVVVTVERDILRDEGVRFACRLREAGALAAHIDVADVGHGFNLADAPRRVVEGVYERIAAEVRRAVT
ncbi:alpha/beta hydrolase [Brachybacterium massiliense]|uniref:alpha/beta hydrolase n=1 Tax=Brachybacterium massiliense TaxID=1755098 RepID=UPI000B3BAFFF|nr:alpha/beta hydrolase [Brachybacterium massiliense]